MTYMQVAFQQGRVDDLQQFLAAFDGGRTFHERGSRGGVRVVELLYQVAAFL